MNDKNDTITFVPRKGGHECRVSYTINNFQPVLCTIIGSEPMFYLDMDEEMEDRDAGLYEDNISILESEILNLKKEIELFERFSENFSKDQTKKSDWLEEAKNSILNPAASSAKAPIEETIAILSKTRLAAAYLDFLHSDNVSIAYNDQIEDAVYCREAGKIFVHPRFDLEDRVLLIARELRRHWQHRQGVLVNPLVFHPDSAILIQRAQTADLMTAVIRIAWELQLSGIKEPWERIERSPMADLGRAFAYEAFLDFRTLNNGQAAASVFECWFLSERCKKEDKNLIRQLLADSQGQIFDAGASEATLTPAIITSLGSMPYGKNYLAAHAKTILEDPLFREVRDRSNANFLWFIKFERSFRETERQLQTKSGPDTDGVRRTISETMDFDDAQTQPADIVYLSGRDPGLSGDKSARFGLRADGGDSGKRTKSGRTGNVVYLRNHRGE